MPTPYHLSLPPREIPWPVRTQVLFGGFAQQFGWLFFGFGAIFAGIFGSMADLSLVYFAIGQVETGAGVVSAVERTDASEGDVPVYANHYTFRVERLEQEYRGVSYTTGQRFSAGQEVTIEYLSQNPDTSRIQETRGNIFSPWVLCFVVIFPAVGLGFIVTGFRSGLKGNRLLANGKIGSGRLISSEPTNTRINRRTVYKLTFEFTAEDGRTYQAVAKTHEPHHLQDEAEERLLYDAYNPAYAVLLDNLPGAPDIDETGQIYSADVGRSLRVLIVPGLALVVLSAIFLATVLR